MQTLGCKAIYLKPMTLKENGKMVKTAGILALTAFLAGCGGLNSQLVNQSSTVEYLRIYDIKTDLSRDKVGEAVAAGLKRTVNAVRTELPLLNTSQVPSAPGRIKVENPFAGTAMGTLGAVRVRVASCDGATWIANANRNTVTTAAGIGTAGTDLEITACLFPYKDGYHLNLYGRFIKGGGGLASILTEATEKVVGTPEEWTEKTLLDAIRSVRLQTGASVSLVEAQPQIRGTPWLDQFDKTGPDR